MTGTGSPGAGPSVRGLLQRVRAARRAASRYLKDQYRLVTTGGLECLNPSRETWERQWQDASRVKVLMVAPKDFAGSFYGWARAVTRHSADATCRLVAFRKHPYDYEYDYIFHLFRRGVGANAAMARLVDEADALHLKDEQFFFDAADQPETSRAMVDLIERFQRANKPVIFTHYGSVARQNEFNRAYQRAVQAFDARIALTPDLNYAWFGGSFVPHAVDLAQFPYQWSESRILAHSPSRKAIKGSDLMWEALGEIDDIRREWALDMIEGVDNAECLRRKGKAELFFDQAGTSGAGQDDKAIGWYGNSAVEAMAFGIPTIAHLSEIALQRAGNAGREIRDVCPVLNTGLDRSSMAATVRDYLAMTGSQRRALSRRTRRWVETFHGEDVVGVELGRIYHSVVTAA